MLMAENLFAESYYAHISEDGRVHFCVGASLAGARYLYSKLGDCPRFTDEAKRSRRIGTVPGKTGEFGCGEGGGWRGCGIRRQGYD